MGDERAGFLRDIIENIDDDTPRLIFADWLEDNGDPLRSEFIRLQCQIARMTKETVSAEWLLREKELVERHGWAWRCEAPRWAANQAALRRGFVAMVTCSNPRHFERGGAGLFRRVPVEEFLLHRSDDAVLQAMARMRGIKQLRRLGIGGGFLTAVGLAPLFNSAHLTCLHTLDISYPPQGPGQLDSLVDGVGLVNLQRLILRGGSFGQEGAERLIQAWWVPQLTELRLYGCSLRDDGVTALVNSPRVENLGRLVLWGNEIGFAGAQAIAQSYYLRHVHTLNLGLNPLMNEGLEALCQSATLTNLQYLNLIQIRLDPRSAHTLTRATFASNLKELRIDRSSRTPELEAVFGNRLLHSIDD